MNGKVGDFFVGDDNEDWDALFEGSPEPLPRSSP
jgi:hypothetical protein